MTASKFPVADEARGSPSPAASKADVIAEETARWLGGTFAVDAARGLGRPAPVTDCGIDVKPLYTPADLEAAGFDYRTDLGFPGEYPFTRGDRGAMNRGEGFVVSAYSGFGEARVCNGRFRTLLDWGVEQILVAFDLPTQCGYDSDHPMATAEVGQVGVAVSSLADMELLFEGIPLDGLKRVGTLGNSIGPIVLALFAALGEKQGVPWSRYVVNLQNDPLKEYIARGTQILPAAPAAKLACDAVEWCIANAPGWSPMTVCVNHINAGGAGSSLGTAIALANAGHYIDDLLARGHSIDDVAPLIHMFPDERHDFFVAIANLRALRRIWARRMRERYGATRAEAMALRTTVYGHGQEALQEPLNNVARIGFGTLAYVLGGASYVYIASYDEAVSTPGEASLKVALRTQQVIAHEHGFADTIDPLGGSYYVETLTHEVERQILDALEVIEARGGALPVIQDGFGRQLMTTGAVRRQKAIDTGRRPWVTVNLWPQKPDVANTAFRIDPSLAREQLARLDRVRAERDGARVAAALREVRAAAQSGANVMPSVLEAVRAYATVGEIVDVWRDVFGHFSPSTDF
ncbi:methylmalonyl-CoA mutase family protein [Arenibaculum sp.]|uniref:methylmalonyl-CoA mutase family protein n=1 Tax=Arenibaculum sp. TaxID=2865862 RepID=UPI002E156F02|nr:methylmalonyl-CoA mutase family protein [Arenibaculum sp.]